MLHRGWWTSGNDVGVFTRARRSRGGGTREARRFFAGLPRRYNSSLHFRVNARVGASGRLPQTSSPGTGPTGRTNWGGHYPTCRLLSPAHEMQIHRLDATVGFPYLPFRACRRVSDVPLNNVGGMD